MSDLDSLQAEIGEWGRSTFPHRNPRGIINHLKREVEELSLSGQPEEAADCLILLLHYAEVCGFSLWQEAIHKFEVCKSRHWSPPDAEGVSEHIRQEKFGGPDRLPNRAQYRARHGYESIVTNVQTAVSDGEGESTPTVPAPMHPCKRECT